MGFFSVLQRVASIYDRLQFAQAYQGRNLFERLDSPVEIGRTTQDSLAAGDRCPGHQR
jgi:hypothetical protein